MIATGRAAAPSFCLLAPAKTHGTTPCETYKARHVGVQGYVAKKVRAILRLALGPSLCDADDGRSPMTGRARRIA